VPPNLQYVAKEIIDVHCPEGATFSECSLGKSLDYLELLFAKNYPLIEGMSAGNPNYMSRE
jgi:hypothetical protein